VVVRLREDGPTAMPHQPTLIDLHRSSSAGVRILLADDFAPWRSQVRSFLQSETKWKIVFEACDGLEAVQKTVELRPDIVLLDISMPRLNGIDAARRICQLLPDSKIIILTQYADEDVMTAALEAGALAYVLKVEMTTDLIPAIQAVLRTRC
jgi:DNA-binding NarL/FixJ family response regulator